MGDVITRFKLETTQYDSKLRDSAKRLSELTERLQLAGKDFNKFAQNHVQVAQSLGQVASGATNTKEKLRDLVNAYNMTARAYNNLTKEQQQGDFGRAMSASLQKLQRDITATKNELYSLGNESKNTGGIMSQLADKFVVNFDAMKLFNAGLAAAKGSLQVLSDAFFASEANVDEWGRIMDSSKSLYQGFLNAINTGDISGFMARIDTIVQAARAAYNELDRLGTMKTIQAPQVSAQQAENERFRIMLRTGRYVAPLDGRTPSMPNGTILRPDQLKQIEGFLESGMQKVVTLVGNEVQQTGKAIEALYSRQAVELGLSIGEFRKGTSSMAEFDRRMAGAAQYAQWQQKHSYVDQQTGRLVEPRTGNPYAAFRGWDVFRVDGERYNQIIQLIQQRDQQASSVYSTQGQAYQAINRADRRMLSGGGGGGGGGGTGRVMTEEETNNARIRVLTEEYKRASDERRAAIRKEISTLQERNRELKRLEDEAKGVSAKTITQASLSPLQQMELEAANVRAALPGAGSPEEYKEMKDYLDALLLDIKKYKGELKEIQQTKGFSGLTEGALGAWISGQQSDLSKMQLGGADYVATSANIVDAQTLSAVMKTAVENGIEIDASTREELWEKIINAEDIPDNTWEELVAVINEHLAAADIDPIKIDLKTGNISKAGKETADSWKAAAQAVGSVGNALQQINDPAAKVVGIVGEAVANIALGFAQATAKDSKLGVFGWIAAVAGGLGTMISTIAAIRAQTKGGFAQGGIVPGNSFSGDLLHTADYGINSGELILSRSQQDNIASQLQNNGWADNMALTTEVSGENLLIVLNRNNLRRGRGTLAFNKG